MNGESQVGAVISLEPSTFRLWGQAHTYYTTQKSHLRHCAPNILPDLIIICLFHWPWPLLYMNLQIKWILFLINYIFLVAMKSNTLTSIIQFRNHVFPLNSCNNTDFELFDQRLIFVILTFGNFSPPLKYRWFQITTQHIFLPDSFLVLSSTSISQQSLGNFSVLQVPLLCLVHDRHFSTCMRALLVKFRCSWSEGVGQIYLY